MLDFARGEAALARLVDTDPLKSRHAPKTPFAMAQYMQPQLDGARQQSSCPGSSSRWREASQNSDKFVLLTVLFASVLFFGGISGTFDSSVANGAF